jgi:hypothetical protein
MNLRFFALVLALWLAPVAPAEVITQTSTVDGVTVAVTAGNLSPEASVWDFAVVLTSNRKALPDDVFKNAVLVDPSGHKYRALIWESAPQSGLRRAGVLKFIAIRPRPEWIELRIDRPGESKPRKFGWLLGAGLMAAHWDQIPVSN